MATTAYASEHLTAVIGQDRVPTAVDAINGAGCEFEAPVSAIRIELTGPSTQSVVIPLPEPTTSVGFPVDESIEVPRLDVSLPDGRYDRQVSAVLAGSGDAMPLLGFEPVILVRDPNGPMAHLLKAESRWDRGGVDTYAYVASWQCFCPSDYRAQVQVQVVDNLVTEVTFAEPGEREVPDPQRFGTVEELFGFIRNALSGGAVRVDATYHDALGFPTEVFVDLDERIADEEQGFMVHSLAPGP